MTAPAAPEIAPGEPDARAAATVARPDRPVPWRLVPAPVRTIRQMRIVLATPTREEGGVLRNVLDLAEGAAARGHHVVVATPGDAAVVRAAVEAHDLPWMDLRRSTRLRADVWHLHVPNSLDTALLALLTRRRWVAGARVLTEHLPRTARTDASLPLDPTLKHGRRKPGAEQGKTAFKRLEFSLVDQVIAPGAAAAEFLAQRYGLPRSAVQAIHNGIAAPEDPPPPPPGDVMEVVVVGMLAHRKGHDVLLEACRLAERSWNVTCVGDGPLREALEEEARAIEGRRVQFTGWRADAGQAPLEAHVACVPVADGVLRVRRPGGDGVRQARRGLGHRRPQRGRGSWPDRAPRPLRGPGGVRRRPRRARGRPGAAPADGRRGARPRALDVQRGRHGRAHPRRLRRPRRASQRLSGRSALGGAAGPRARCLRGIRAADDGR